RVVADGETPRAVMALALRRAEARARRAWGDADALRDEVRDAGWEPRDGYDETLLTPVTSSEQLISHSSEVVSQLEAPDRFAVSVCLLADENRDEVERTLRSATRHHGNTSLEVVITDNGSTGETYHWLRQLAHDGQRDGVPVRVIFADHDMGFAAGRNAALRA